MSCFEKEGSWNLSFSGAGFLGLYHVGVIHCLRQRAPRLLRGASRFYGSSSGALIAVSVVSGLSVRGLTAWTRSAGSIGLPARVEADSNLRGWERRGVSQGAWRRALRSLQPACSHLILMRTPRTWDHGHPHFLEDKSEA